MGEKVASEAGDMIRIAVNIKKSALQESAEKGLPALKKKGRDRMPTLFRFLSESVVGSEELSGDRLKEDDYNENPIGSGRAGCQRITGLDAKSADRHL